MSVFHQIYKQLLWVSRVCCTFPAHIFLHYHYLCLRLPDVELAMPSELGRHSGRDSLQPGRSAVSGEPAARLVGGRRRMVATRPATGLDNDPR